LLASQGLSSGKNAMRHFLINHLPNERGPTQLELWARLEAKSPTKAFDLQREASTAADRRRRNTPKPLAMRVLALLLLGAVFSVASFRLF
jgi:hypothetical protein